VIVGAVNITNVDNEILTEKLANAPAPVFFVVDHPDEDEVAEYYSQVNFPNWKVRW
jgi:hypothetical protein